MSWERVDPAELGEPRGWTNGMLAPSGARVLFVAGQDATDAGGAVTTDDFVEQFDLVLDKVLTVVRAAGGDADSIGRMMVYVTDMDTYLEARTRVGEVWRSRMGRHYPAMALVEVSRLVDPRGQVEIEATAVLDGGR